MTRMSYLLACWHRDVREIYIYIYLSTSDCTLSLPYSQEHLHALLAFYFDRSDEDSLSACSAGIASLSPQTSLSRSKPPRPYTKGALIKPAED